VRYWVKWMKPPQAREIYFKTRWRRRTEMKVVKALFPRLSIAAHGSCRWPVRWHHDRQTDHIMVHMKLARAAAGFGDGKGVGRAIGRTRKTGGAGRAFVEC
jgi:hypothetical protein